MAACILDASPVQLFHIFSVILVGAFGCHLLIQLIRRKIASRKTAPLTWPDRQFIKRGFSSSENVVDEKYPVQTCLPAQWRLDERGLLATLPSRTNDIKATNLYTPEEKKQALHNLIISAHNENSRSTYLGASTFQEYQRSAYLFGWRRQAGQPTVLLGDVASIEEKQSQASLALRLHPQDAQIVIDNGWGEIIRSGLWPKLSSKTKASGVQVSMYAPRSDYEAHNITRQVLKAAVWWVSGLDGEESA